MNSGPNSKLFNEIQSLCREFRKQLKAGQSPGIDEYLPHIDSSARETLFQSLLHLDVEFRRRRGEDPTSQQYVERFPQFARLIRQAFFESTIMSQEMLGDTSHSDEPTVSLPTPAARILGDYELLSEVGRGGFGVVYEAKHLRRGDRVALKTLPAIGDGQAESSHDAERLHRFRHEFRSLSEINHPNLVGMQTLEVDGSQWFFTMDLIEGVNFLGHVRPGGKLDEARLRAALQQLARGIIALHERAIVHRDLKPSNVLVGSDGHLVILDFGLVAELQHLASETLSVGTERFAGTPRYAAPEQAYGQRSAAVDWYALGVMLYEAITGEAPFKGVAVDLLIAKQTTDPPKLRERDGVPRDLAELVDGMLRRDPKERPSDDQIAESLGIHPETSSHGNSSAESSLVEVSGRQGDQLLVGRASQLAQLEQRSNEFAARRQPQAVFISGRSGEGKTSLAEKFLSGVRRQGKVLVLAGRCYDRESVPFKAIDCWTDSLVSYLRKLGTEHVAQVLPQDIAMLARLFPILRRVTAVDDVAGTSVSNVDSRQARFRAFAALKELLISIGRRTPVILFIDDVQWGDADSASALHEILKPSDGPAVMLLCSYRSDEADDSPFLSMWRKRQSEAGVALDEWSVEVAPLSEDECLQLASIRLGQSTESIKQQFREFHQRTQGNPYFVEQLLEGFDAQSANFRVVPLEEIIGRKLARLPVGAKRLLESIAIAGQAVTLAEAAAVCEQSANAFSVVTHMRSERLARLIGSGGGQHVDTYHDKIRETVLAGLEQSRRLELHARHAAWLERQEDLSIESVTEHLKRNAHSARNRGVESDRVFDIAHHYFEANHEHAFAYLLLAGITSLISHAGDEALTFLRRASQVIPEQTETSIRYLLWLSMGRACLICKESEQASEYLEQALGSAGTELQQAMVYMGLATADRFSGRFQQGIDRYDLALRLIGTPRPRTKLKALVSILRDNWSALLAGSPRMFRDPSEVEESDASALQYAALRELGVFLVEKDMLAFLACASKACRLSAARGTAESMISGYEWAAGFLGAAGLLPLAKIYHRRAERIEQIAADPRVSEQRLLHFFGYDYWAGNLSVAEGIMERSWHATMRVGEHNEATYRPHMLRHIATYIRSTSIELNWANTALRSAEELGSEQQICWGTYDVGVAQARRGNLAAARIKMEESLKFLHREPHYMTESIRAASLGFICLQCSDYQQACELARKAWRNAVRNLILLDVAAYSLPIYMESLAGPRWIDGLGMKERRQLRRISWWAKAMFRTLPNHQPHLLRVSGRYHAGCGRRRKATKRFSQSVENARAREMEYAQARALLDLAALSPQNADPLRSEAIGLLRKTESVIPYAECWLLGDQDAPDVVAPPPEEFAGEVPVEVLQSTGQRAPDSDP